MVRSERKKPCKSMLCEGVPLFCHDSNHSYIKNQYEKYLFFLFGAFRDTTGV
jgi:hypothetical protein